MKKLLLLLLIISVLKMTITQAQNCANADFENGTLSGWTGTWGDGVCIQYSGLNCIEEGSDPFQYIGLNQGSNNHSANALPEKNHFIMTGGYDPIIGGSIIPVVYPNGGTYSIRLGNAQSENGAESISYTFSVENINSAFIYHFASVIMDGSHMPSQLPYFKIRMFDENNDTIDCVTYDINAATIESNPQFTEFQNLYYNNWMSVLIPLADFVGQTVRIQFITSDCNTNFGSHFAYTYLDAECGTAEISASANEICSDATITLTAPEGVSSYSWSGPGIVGADNTQTITVNTAGNYTVTMATIGSTPCNFSLSTTITEITPAPVADFTLYPDVEPLHYIAENHATGTPPLTYSWDWGDGNFDNIAYPSHTYDVSGNYTICLTITDANNCTDTYCNDYTFKTESPIAYINVIDPLTVGIAHTEKEKDDLVIYPNPATNNLIVETVNAFGIYQLEDITGKVLLSGSITANKFSLDISALSKGIYLLSVIDGEQQVNRKVVKE